MNLSTTPVDFSGLTFSTRGTIVGSHKYIIQHVDLSAERVTCARSQAVPTKSAMERLEISFKGLTVSQIRKNFDMIGVRSSGINIEAGATLDIGPF